MMLDLSWLWKKRFNLSHTEVILNCCFYSCYCQIMWWGMLHDLKPITKERHQISNLMWCLFIQGNSWMFWVAFFRHFVVAILGYATSIIILHLGFKWISFSFLLSFRFCHIALNIVLLLLTIMLHGFSYLQNVDNLNVGFFGCFFFLHFSLESSVLLHLCTLVLD